MGVSVEGITGVAGGFPASRSDRGYKPVGHDKLVRDQLL